jgi:hypothetical protein
MLVGSRHDFLMTLRRLRFGLNLAKFPAKIRVLYYSDWQDIQAFARVAVEKRAPGAGTGGKIIRDKICVHFQSSQVAEMRVRPTDPGSVVAISTLDFRQITILTLDG